MTGHRQPPVHDANVGQAERALRRSYPAAAGDSHISMRQSSQLLTCLALMPTTTVSLAMVKHGTYRIDAPPPFQGTWTVTVDRVHYRFNHLRMCVVVHASLSAPSRRSSSSCRPAACTARADTRYLLRAGDCQEVYLRHLSGNEYGYDKCYFHRGVYDGFCPFVGTRYRFDDEKMRAARMPTEPEAPPDELEPRPKPHSPPAHTEGKAGARAVTPKDFWAKIRENKNDDSLIIPMSASPEPMSTVDRYVPRHTRAERSHEVKVTIQSVHTTDTDGDGAHSVFPDTFDPDSPDTLVQSPFHTPPPIPAPPLPKPKPADGIEPFPYPLRPFVDTTPPTTPLDITRAHTPQSDPNPVLAHVHSAIDTAGSLAGTVASLRATLVALETEAVAAREHIRALENTVAHQDECIKELTKDLAEERGEIHRMRRERGRLLLHRARMFEAFGLEDPVVWEDL